MHATSLARRRKLYSRAILYMSLFAAWALLGCSVLSTYFCIPGQPGDDMLIANWQEKRAAFDEIIRDFLKDEKLEVVAETWMRPETLEAAGIDEARLADYKRRMRELWVPSGLQSFGNKDRIWLIASTCGLSISGSSKGYFYLAPGGKLMDWEVVIDGDLDAYRSPDGRSYDVLRPLGDGWYLYYSYED